MTTDQQKFIEQLNYSYDLDCGGYSWEPCDLLEGCYQWDDPDLDYFPFIDDQYARDRFHGLSCPVLMFRPSEMFMGIEWPSTYQDEMRLIDHGQVAGSDRDCHCHGKPDDQGQWEFTGNYQDAPFEDCPRCDGSGYVDSMGGYWALYALAE